MNRERPAIRRSALSPIDESNRGGPDGSRLNLERVITVIVRDTRIWRSGGGGRA